LLCRFSVSNDLKYDAERDLKDIEASHIPVHALNKVGREAVKAVWKISLQQQLDGAALACKAAVASASAWLVAQAAAGSKLLALPFSQMALAIFIRSAELHGELRAVSCREREVSPGECKLQRT